jgi:hypothetical protein
MMNVGGTELTATLEDNATARDFATLLPLTLTLEDYAATEKISTLPRKLSTAGAPPGTSASIGDIMCYTPWGNLAIFYRASGYAAGLVKLGAIDGDIQVFERPGTLQVTIDLSEA